MSASPTDTRAERNRVLGMNASEMHDLLARGRPVVPEAIAGATFRGISLGLPGWVDRISWKTFMKAFAYEEPAGMSGASRRVRGWNVRMEQHGIDGPVRPRLRGGKPWTFGHFGVRMLRDGETPVACGPGVLLDYGVGQNPRLDPTRVFRDAVVSIDGSPDLLLGVMYLSIAGRSIRTPSFFTLERHAPLAAGQSW